MGPCSLQFASRRSKIMKATCPFDASTIIWTILPRRRGFWVENQGDKKGVAGHISLPSPPFSFSRSSLYFFPSPPPPRLGICDGDLRPFTMNLPGIEALSSSCPLAFDFAYNSCFFCWIVVAVTGFSLGRFLPLCAGDFSGAASARARVAPQGRACGVACGGSLKRRWRAQAGSSLQRRRRCATPRCGGASGSQHLRPAPGSARS